eukprot:4426235-Amphidinium_carterae.1
MSVRKPRLFSDWYLVAQHVCYLLFAGASARAHVCGFGQSTRVEGTRRAIFASPVVSKKSSQLSQT